MLTAAGLLLSLSFVGCGSTSEHRARQYSTAFGALPDEAQQRALAGGITLGDSREAVYIALGPPQGQMIADNVELWEYNARPLPAESPFTSGQVEYYITPSSQDWSFDWSGQDGYLSLEFEDGVLDKWDYTEGGFQIPVRTQKILLPPGRE